MLEEGREWHGYQTEGGWVQLEIHIYAKVGKVWFASMSTSCVTLSKYLTFFDSISLGVNEHYDMIALLKLLIVQNVYKLLSTFPGT